MRTTRAVRWLIGGLCFFSTALQAQNAENRLMPPKFPTEVGIAAYVIAIDHISPASDAFPHYTVDVFLDLEWRDPRLTFVAGGIGTAVKTYEEQEVGQLLSQIWHPGVTIRNSSGPREVTSRLLRISEDGSVGYIERFKATIATNFDLTRFPFDRQSLIIEFESLQMDNNSIIMVPLDNAFDVNTDFDHQEWSVVDQRHRVLEVEHLRQPGTFSRFEAEIVADRKSGFYIYRILLPFLLIVLLGWATLWIEAEHISDRMERYFLVLLTVVAFHQLSAEHLPKLSFHTLLDAIIFSAYLFIGLTIYMNIRVFRLQRKKNLQAANRIDSLTRILLPGGFALTVLLIEVKYFVFPDVDLLSGAWAAVQSLFGQHPPQALTKAL